MSMRPQPRAEGGGNPISLNTGGPANLLQPSEFWPEGRFAVPGFWGFLFFSRISLLHGDIFGTFCAMIGKPSKQCYGNIFGINFVFLFLFLFLGVLEMRPNIVEFADVGSH